MRIRVAGDLGVGVTGKDVIRAIIAGIGAGVGVGYAIEYAGSAIRDLSMEGRLTVSNMTIEAGARIGMMAPDEKTRSEEHTSELQSLMRISYAVFCLKQKNQSIITAISNSRNNDYKHCSSTIVPAINYKN